MTGPRRSVEVIAGPQGTGRSARLAERMRAASPDAALLLVDSGDHWSSSRRRGMPDGTVVIRPRAFHARGTDPSEVVAIAMHRLPGSTVGIDDAECLGLDDRGWARLYAAASASGCVLVVVLGQGAAGHPAGARLPGAGRVAALAAHGA